MFENQNAKQQSSTALMNTWPAKAQQLAFASQTARKPSANLFALVSNMIALHEPLGGLGAVL